MCPKCSKFQFFPIYVYEKDKKIYRAMDFDENRYIGFHNYNELYPKPKF